MEDNQMDHWMSTGVRLAQSGELAEAAKYFAQAVKTDPASAPAWYWLGGTIDDPEKKKYCLERAASIDADIAQKIDLPGTNPPEATPVPTVAEPEVEQAASMSVAAPVVEAPPERQAEKKKEKSVPKRGKARWGYILIGIVFLLALLLVAAIAWMYFSGMVRL